MPVWNIESIEQRPSSTLEGWSFREGRYVGSTIRGRATSSGTPARIDKAK
jgi:hypothetical protein